MNLRTQLVPQQSPNDSQLKIIRWLVDEGSLIPKGRDICTVEGSKMVFDLQAEYEGYIYFLIKEGESAGINSPFALFSVKKDENAKSDFLKTKQVDEKNDLNNKKFTKKAELVAKQNSIDIADIRKDGIVREEDVLDYINSRVDYARYATHEELAAFVDLHLKKRVVVLGAGVGAAQIVDIIVRSGQQEVVGILDDNEHLHGRTILGKKILGPIEMIHQLAKTHSFDGAVISFSKDLSIRMKIFVDLEARGIHFTNVIDPSVQINCNVSLGTGNVVLAGVVIAACVRLGNNNFISAHVNIEHHNVVGDGCSFGPGVMTSGEVKIGNQVKFGTGIYIEPQIQIGSKCIISSGLVIISHVPEEMVVKKSMDYKIVSKNETQSVPLQNLGMRS